MKRFSFRSAACMFVIMALLTVATLRVAVIVSDDGYRQAAAVQNSYRLTAAHQRGTVFDTKMKPITNAQKAIITAVAPTDNGYKTIKKYLSSKQQSQLKSNIKNGIPSCFYTADFLDGQDVKSISVTLNHTQRTLAEHLIGYTDGAYHGVSGLEKAFDEFLYSDSSVDFCFVRNSHGNIVNDFKTVVERDVSVTRNGIKISIDTDIQAAAEGVAKNQGSGALLVSEIGTGKIRAMVSTPGFDTTAVEEYLNDNKSPLINRALSAYNVGSVFKLCVAAAALETGAASGFTYNCVGQETIAGKTFACHKHSGHGNIDLKTAIAQSCNTYFYALAEKTGWEAIYNLAQSLGFGNEYTIAGFLSSDKGCLPTPLSVADNKQKLANLAIGQGELMLSPIALLTLYEAVANGGIYYRPTVFEGYVRNMSVYGAPKAVPTRAFSNETADILKEALMEVIKSGTGRAAKPALCSAAGKTATAQTGWIRDGRAVEHSWFCGFFPIEAPRYVIVMISEDANGEGTSCAPLFSELVDIIYTIKLS